MSNEWNMWDRNVVDKYKNWSTESIKKDLQRNANPFAVCMEHWSGDYNISTLIRNANAFNAEEVFYIGKKRWDRRGAVGTHNYTPLTYLKSYKDLASLKEKYTIIGIDNNLPKTKKLDQFDWKVLDKPPLMIFGEEKTGLSKEALKICHLLLEIPQYGSVRSLNVGTSSGVLMYDFVRAVKNSTTLYTKLKQQDGETYHAQNESSQLTLL
jgi:tRNA G18 (ribose-2'-O)-methylase SpoU